MLHRIVGILFLALSLGGGWLWMDYRQFIDASLPIGAEELVYQLAPGASAASLARDLKRLGLLERPLYLRHCCFLN